MWRGLRLYILSLAFLQGAFHFAANVFLVLSHQRCKVAPFSRNMPNDSFQEVGVEIVPVMAILQVLNKL